MNVQQTPRKSETTVTRAKCTPYYRRMLIEQDVQIRKLPDVPERIAKGKEARKRTPRESFADWKPAADRPDPVALLAGQETSRIQALLPVRHERMSASEFAFYRGTAIVMANDLGVISNTGLVTQICGDAHMSNFGMFAAPDRSVIFDVNDFDETNPGPFEWDIIRLAVSALLAGRDNGLKDSENLAAVAAAITGYQFGIARYAEMSNLQVWYDRISVDALTQIAQDAGDKKGAKGLEKGLAKAKTRDAWSAAMKLTEVNADGQRRFLNQPPLIAPVPMDGEIGKRALEMMKEYYGTLPEAQRHLLSQYSLVDIGHKVVGVGSVGLLSIIALFQGRDENDLLILQFKQAQQSVLEPFSGASEFDQSGHRVVAGQRLMQAASDSFLGWVTGALGREYYVRQLRDMKWSPDLATFKAESLAKYAALCGGTLARAHARSGDAVAISAYLGAGKKFTDAMVQFSLAYAKQVSADYQEFLAAVADGRLAADHQAPASMAAHVDYVKQTLTTPPPA